MRSNDTPGAFQQPHTLIDMLRAHVERRPDKIALTFLAEAEGSANGQEEIAVTYAGLDRRARAIGAYLQSRAEDGQSVAGQRALLLFPPGLDFVAAFFGCLYAGVVAVPAYPPRLNRPSPRIAGIAADAEASLALTTGKILEGLKKRFKHAPDLAALDWLDLETISNERVGEWREPSVTGQNLAFLQYTSGSTGTPKGVMLNHDSVLANLEVIRSGFQIDQTGKGAFWLPSFHDMGLIGGILEPIYLGASSVLMAPAAFLQRPVRWLEMISHYKATISGAPNFAYKMCVDKVTEEQRRNLDLSSWQVAFCGAEPIREETLSAFADTFAAHGFRGRSFYPCYGLAESALLVTGGDGPAQPIVTHVDSAALAQGYGVTAEENGTETTTLVSCGTARPDHHLVIVDPESMALCADGQIGEIWTAGPSVAPGYWRREEETKRTFRAYVAQSGDGPFLRTGDLGFLRDGQLFVTGRLKDLIIIRGRNYYPHDIEYTVAESHDALEMDTGAAFSVEVDGEEKLVVVHEMKRERRKTPLQAILPAVRGAVAREHQIQVHALILIRPLSMPRTSSGKVKRRRCREMYLNGELKVLGEWRDNEKRKIENGKHQTENEKPGTGNGERGTGNEERSARSESAPSEIINRKSQIENWLVRRLAEVLGLVPGEVDVGRPVVEFGLDSVQAVELVADLEDWLGLSLAPTLVWDYPTIEALAGYLTENIKQKKENGKQTAGNGELRTVGEEIPNSNFRIPNSNEPVAVVGIGCRFPGADSPEAFWRLLQEGRDLIEEAPADRWPMDTYFSDGPEPAQGKMNTRWGGFLEGVDQFDADFFGIAPREAARMDPQQRLLLEVAWEALENAGIDPTSLAGSATGVFMGISSYDYSRLQFSRPDLIDAYAGTGNAHSIAANRLSYFLDLRGPSMAVDTACSSSLVATHMAMQSLRQGETDAALAGGVNLILSPELTITFSQARMMAADGRCKTFDAAADGYVRGEGCGILVLKRLSDARRDGDPILAVLRGSAVNQDGRSNGLTAPNGLAQQAVIRSALAVAEVSASDIDVIEAHGTGTRLGDPIEVRALQAVFDADGAAPGGPLWVGSVKTNAGHLEAAAGAAGLIKTILALTHEALPPHLHLRTLNPHINLEGSRLVIDGRGRAWPRSERPRLAGVSSFGFGGTNAHVIVEEAPDWNAEIGMRNAQCGPQVLMLSAKNEAALREMALRYADFLGAHSAVSLADVCNTAAKGRARFEMRLAVVASKAEEMREALLQEAESIAQSAVLNTPRAPQPKSVAFLFTGQGAQYASMGRRLYETEAVFREALDRCAAILDTIQGAEGFPGNSKFPGKWQLLDVLFAAEGDSQIDETQYTQPALFALEYALAQLWRSWGIEPQVVIGHSVGEYMAACVAGVMSLEDGLRLVTARGRLMGRLPLGEGSMAAVFAPEAQVRASIAPFADDVAIAALNGPTHTVISGAASAVVKAVEVLAAAGLETRPLAVSHAFHSPLMDPILDAFEAAAKQCRFEAPRIPFVSNLTGDFMTAAPEARYWREHLRRAVQFEAGIRRIVEMDPDMMLLEIGPQPHLTGMARRIISNAQLDTRSWQLLASMRRGQDERQVMLESVGRLFEMGYEPHLLDMTDSHSDYGRSLFQLPTYPFQRERYWLETAEDALGAGSGSIRQVSVERVEQRREGAGSERPKRLATAVPLFESWVDFAAAGDHAALLRGQAAAVAGLFWGEGAHEFRAVEVNEEQVRQLADRDSGAGQHFKLQTMLDELDEQTAALRIFGQDGAHGSWVLLAWGELRRLTASSKQLSVSSNQLTANSGVLNSEQLLLNSERLSAYLQKALAAVLGLGGRKVPGDRSLDTLGLDSLMALELKNRFEKELGLDLPVVSLLKGPTLSELAEMLAAVARDQETAVGPVLAPQTAIGQPAPLSYGQQAMWLLHQLLPADVALNVAGAARLVGAVDADALERALERLVEKHGALRTVFTVSSDAGSAGQPVQIVQEAMAAPLARVDAAAWGDAAVDAYLQREAYRPFDLENGPLLRLVLLKRGGNEHDLLLAINHLITDFWSMSLLVRDLYLLYQAELSNSEFGIRNAGSKTSNSAFRDLHSAIEVADYARWQAAMLESAEGAAHRAYWLRKLAGELPRLNLPTDRPRPALQTYDGDSALRRIGPALTEKLKQLSQQQGVTLATTLLAAFQTLLHRYTGQDDLLVGSVIAGREHPALQELLGYLINPVALRADFAGRPSFIHFLAQVRETMLEAMAHQDYPLARLAQDLASAGDLTLDPSRPPLFETMFIMQRAQVMAEQGLSAFALGVPGAALQLDGLTIESRPLAGLPAQFDLTLMAAELGDGLAMAFHYNTHLFDASTMVRMLAHLETLLQGIAADPRRPVNEIPLLPADEQRLQLVSWNETAADYPRDKGLHELVAEQSARTPQKTAVTCEGESLTYAELEQGAEALAERLRGLGIGPGSLVALQVERSLEMVTGLLGILKTGAAYIPIDPDFPDERIRLMLEDAGPAGVLTKNRKHKTENGDTSAGFGIRLGTGNWELRTGNGELGTGDRPLATGDCSPDTEDCPLAYVIFTSGSTGRPKGVQITHRAVVNFLTSMQREPGLTADDRLLAVTTLSFDIAVLELFLPLISGAEVVIATREATVDGAQLARLLHEAKITMMQATPTTWRLLLESGWRGKEDLTILCGGEALRPELVQELLPRCKALWNMYGPTETTVWSTIAPIKTADTPIPIGRPIANTRVYLLDDNLQPVPVGAVGQLYIAGDGVARGYLNRPELTAKRFVSDPFAGNEQYSLSSEQYSVDSEKNSAQGLLNTDHYLLNTMYRTGDLGRYLSHGALLHLGRDDFQVKVRGFRIELGEIETAVNRHPAVSGSVTVAREVANGDVQLVTYWTAEAGAEAVSAGELRDFLRTYLPGYMIPAHFMLLDALPTTPNGKLDRRALPQPPATRVGSQAPYAAPRSELEKELTALCAEVLGLEQVGIFDNFFDLGGSSLSAARLVFQLRERFEAQIPLRQLFQEPTVAGLSRAISTARLDRRNGNGNGHEIEGNLPLAVSNVDLRAEAKSLIAEFGMRNAEYRRTPHSTFRTPRSVLLTGATGFLGAYLLRDLLCETGATVTCLVRAENAADALQRIQGNMAGYDLWDEAFAARIVALPGDLGKPQLGLSAEQFAELGARLDAVYHNGAMVNFVHAYRRHRAVNVLGTREILRLASQGSSAAPVHFISTLSVFHDGGEHGGVVFREDADLDAVKTPFGGYAQSKWVAEKLVMAAIDQGAPAAIYRPGLISGDSVNGAWNTADMMTTMALACAATGTAPDLDVLVDIVPVDYVSRAIVALAGRPESLGSVFHLNNPQPVRYDDLLAWTHRAGLPLQVVSFDSWRAGIVALAMQLGGDNWNPFLPLLEEVTADQIFMPAIDCQNTLAGLAAAAEVEDGQLIRCPNIDARLLETYIAFLRRQGLLSFSGAAG